jgi:hypothetical protein
MPPATHRITLLSATSLASVVAVAGVQPADAAVVYTVQVRDPAEITQSTNAVTTPLSVTEVLGVASGGGTLLTTTNPAYTLVGTTASRAVSFARRTTGNQLGTTNFSVTTPTTASSAIFTAPLGGTTITNTTTSRNFVVSVAPTERSAGSTIAGTFTLTGVNSRNNSQGSWTYTGGTQDNTNFTFQTIAVAPVAATSTTGTGTTQYVLVGSGGTATGSFTVKNTGDGTLAGANLTGTVTNTLGTGFTASAPTGAISLGDSNLAGPNGTSLTQTVTYKDEGTRSGTVRVASSVATFTNGSADGKNNAAASVTTGFSAQSVAPLASVTATLNAGTVRVGTSSAVALTVQNVGDGNLAGKDNGTTLLTNLRGTVGAGTGSFSGGGGAVNLTDTTGGQSAANASSTYMFNYAPTARTNGLTESVSVSTTLQNGASNANVAGSSTTTLSGIAVGPDFDAAVAGKNASSGPIINGGTIRFGDSVGGLTLQDLLISNLSNDAASKALTDLTLTNVTITGSTEFSFSISGFDSGNSVGFGTSSTNAVLSNLKNGDGSGNIAIQFVNKAGNGAAQLRIETDEGAALGGAGAVYVYNLIWSVPEPGTIAIFGAGLLGLAISRQRRRGRAFVALTAKPEEEARPSAR